MIPAHQHGSVLWTLDSSLRKHFARIEDPCSKETAESTATFFEHGLDWLRKHLTSGRDPWRSKELWRLDGRRKVPEGDEKRLAYDLCHLAPDLYREIPAASGVVDWDGHRNKLANLDIVREVAPAAEYEFIELKIASDTPEYAAATLVRYALLFVLARTQAPAALREARPILQATKVVLRVWAPPEYYDGFDGRRLQEAISDGLRILTAGLIDGFSFISLDPQSGRKDDVDWIACGGRLRRPIAHVPGPVRLWLRQKLANSPRPLLFDPNWQHLVGGRPHRGFDAPDSSQAFGINLFAPLARDADLAKAVLQRFFPGLVSDSDKVSVAFEQSFEQVARRLNENGKSTQVDVVFTISGPGGERFVLTEVKLAEEQFGGCKGWFDRDAPPTRNPNRGRCVQVEADQSSNCYMAIKFGRTYWAHLSALPAETLGEPCPFRGSLYQLMRNALLARLIGKDSAQFVVCVHPSNHELMELELPVLGHHNAIVAAQAVLGIGAMRVWDSRDLIEYVATTNSSLRGWRDWLVKRYFEGVTPLPAPAAE